MTDDVLFEPLKFRNLTVKNRLFRSSISGRIDNYDGSGTPARAAWEAKFARGGVGAIVSAHVPVAVGGRILPNYATIDRDARIPFWEEVVRRVHAHECKFILQLSHAGHQQDIAGVENLHTRAPSSTDAPDFFHGIASRAMTLDEIDGMVETFARAAARAKAAGVDGVELHACNGYLFTQFLSSAVNDREDDYGGSLENRARFLRRVVRAIRAEVGPDYHVQAKISGTDFHDALQPWLKKGNTIEDSVTVARWLEEDGVDALHVSTGSFFPHPRNPPGVLPAHEAGQNYDTMLSSGSHGIRNYVAFRFMPSVSKAVWERTTVRAGVPIEGVSLDDARAIKAAVSVPVLSTGGYQRASFIRDAITSGACDAVAIARPLMANPDLPRMFARGLDEAPKPCTFCNRCLARVLEDPLGCYDESRYASYDEMIAHVMSFFDEGGWP